MAIWANIQQTVALLIILSILVVAHEWGHFIVARLCGIRVDDFSIGFGPRLFRIAKRGDTEYNVRMLPLGGFVKIAGMEADEAPLIQAKDRVMKRNTDDPDAKEIPLIAENTGENVPYNAPDGFYSKPIWQRALVILAGPVMSFLLGYVVFCLMGVTTGVPTGKVLPRIGLVEPGGEGQKIGLHTGDVITAINGQPINDGMQMITQINGSMGKTITLTLHRDGQILTKTATPRMAIGKDGKPVTHTDVVQPGLIGRRLGLQSGDTLLGIGSAPVDNAAAAMQTLRSDAGKPIEIVISRPTSNDPIPLHGVLPALLKSGDLPSLNSHGIGVLKIDPSSEIEHLSLTHSVKEGTQLVGTLFVRLAEMVQRPSQLKENAGGIIYMYQATGVAVKSGVVDLVFLAAQLSISLAIFNMLPIPVLDGGHLLTFFIEWVRRGKRLTEQQQQAFLMTGLAIIGTLFILIMSNDILRTVKHQLPQ